MTTSLATEPGAGGESTRSTLVRRGGGRLAVTLHDVEPATFTRCALIRDWLDDLGVDRVTLLVIPAPDLHPFDGRRPELSEWLAERIRGGDAVAQHGLHHLQSRRGGWPRQLLTWGQGGDSAEFVGLDQAETTRAVDAGRRVLKLAGLEPRGFVAPAYAYTPALRETLRPRFAWWAGLLQLHVRGGHRLAPALGLGTSDAVKRAASPTLLRACARVAGTTMRLDLHPADLDHPRHIGAVEGVLQRAHRRVRHAVTYDDLAL
jgi:predicted deacetylase